MAHPNFAQHKLNINGTTNGAITAVAIKTAVELKQGAIIASSPTYMQITAPAVTSARIVPSSQLIRLNMTAEKTASVEKAAMAPCSSI